MGLKTFISMAFAACALLVVLSCSGNGSGDTASGTGTVNAVMAAERKINISHDPIPELEWPEMTMDFRLADAVSLEGIEAGARVTFQLRKGENGVYEIESLSLSGE
jgi:Cu/Ag efflux protein CusF